MDLSALQVTINNCLGARLGFRNFLCLIGPTALASQAILLPSQQAINLLRKFQSAFWGSCSTASLRALALPSFQLSVFQTTLLPPTGT
jgi:hypothetical protein